jgi:hypothetical protein
MSWQTRSDEAARKLIASDRLLDLLQEMGCRPVAMKGGFRGTCPVCRVGRLTVFINDDPKGKGHIPAGWGCTGWCHLWSHPDLLGLVQGYLGRTNEHAMTYLDNFLHAQPSAH